jgi:hypothetical protein
LSGNQQEKYLRILMIAKKLPYLLLGAMPMLTSADPGSLRDCAFIVDSGARLACFDRLAAADGSQGRDTKQPALSLAMPPGEAPRASMDRPPHPILPTAGN